MNSKPTETNDSGDQPTRLTPESTVQFNPLRIWPALLLVGGMVVTRWVPHLIEDGPPTILMVAALGPLVCGALVMLWWLAASRATGRERIAGVAGVIIAVVATLLLVDKSMHGPAIMMLTVPMGTAGFALGAIFCGRVLSSKRTVVAVLLAVCGFGYSTLLRCDGMWGDFSLGLHWRWQASPEEQMLAHRKTEPSIKLDELAATEIDQALANPEWPAFRGADRTGRQRGPRITSDWSTSSPEQLWKIPIGPAWSSFAVAGKLLFTQEQRGSMEAVVCYDAESGRELWVQQHESRFEEPLGGPGPRATPTLSGGALFALGANGRLMRLNPKTGDVIWQQNLQEVADRKPPMWGFASSPLVVAEVVIVHAGGAGDKGTLAFDAETGDLRWSAASGDHSYSSPQLCTIVGEELVLMLTNTGINLLDPQTGAERLDYEWKHDGYRALQPQVVDGDAILIPTGMGTGTRRIRITKSGAQLAAEEMWTTRNLKPDFNDLVVYQGHAYGFDGSIFTCVDLETGGRKWKRGRYGKGQVLLLEDPGLLLVASEKGDLVLLEANPEAHNEMAKTRALEGKTWNHPVLVSDLLYIRNSQEAACYRLPLVSPTEEKKLAANPD